MRCARCLLQLRRLGPAGRSGGATSARCGASSGRPDVPHHTAGQVFRLFHGSPALAKIPSVDLSSKDDKGQDKSMVAHGDLFERLPEEARTEAAFNKALDVFTKRDVRRRGHVEFIYAALQRMAEFGVERELAAYNRLLDVFPKEVFVPRNYIQRMFNHYPRQQECGVQVLEQMENYGVMPNKETKVLLVQIFGEKSHPMRKYERIMYWFPKFKHANPFPVPRQLPRDPVDLARLSLTRIANDRDARVTVHQMPHTDVLESGEEVTLPHIVGIQSPAQVELLAAHNPSRPVFVEGPFPLWLGETRVYYYTLRADPVPPHEKVEEPYDPERCFHYPLQLDLDLDRDLGDNESFDVEDVDEGPVFAMCATGRGDQATLNQWIAGLQESNPILGQVPTLFRLDAGPGGELSVGDGAAAAAARPAEEETPEEEEEPAAEEPRRSQGVKQ